VLVVCAALLALAGAFVTSAAVSGTWTPLASSVAAHEHACEAQQLGGDERTGERGDSSRTDCMEDAAEEVEGLPARPEATQGLLRQIAVPSCGTQSSERWLKIETPPPRA
jgi:hypothetical protein